MTRPKNDSDKWNAIVSFAASADLDGLEDMDEEEVDAALAKAGFDVAEETRKGQAEHDAAVRARGERPEAPEVRAPKPPARPRPHAPRWLAAPAAVIVALGTAASMLEPVVMVGAGPDAGPPVKDGGVDGEGEGKGK